MDLDKSFERVLNGTFVVTTAANDGKNGMTAAWVTRVSHAPPLILVSVGKKRYTHELIVKGKRFCLNILAEGQLDVAKNFGFSSGRETDKFEGIPHRIGKSGCPVLEGVAGFLDCRLVSAHDAGDHTLFIGEVVDCGFSGKKPILTRMEDYI